MAGSSSSALSFDATLSHITPTIIGQFKRDLYCWVCHLQGPLLKCKTCPRSYHRNCAEQLGNLCRSPTPHPDLDLDHPSKNLMKGCPECQMAVTTVFPNMRKCSEAEFSEICSAIARNLRDGYFWPNPYYKLDSSMPPKSFRSYKDIVARLVDVAVIEEMAKSHKFKTLEGLLAETKWILHNTVVVHGRFSKESDSAKKMVEICEVEILAAELCPECFLKEQNRNQDPDWFVKPCLRQLHPLGWVKTSTFPYWPVKIMQWTAGEDVVTVRAFGDYRRFDVAPTRCSVFSKNPPSFDATSNTYKNFPKEELDKALKEIERHLVLLQELVGPIKLPEKDYRLAFLRSLENIINFAFPNLYESSFFLKPTLKDSKQAASTKGKDANNNNNTSHPPAKRTEKKSKK